MLAYYYSLLRMLLVTILTCGHIFRPTQPFLFNDKVLTLCRYTGQRAANLRSYGTGQISSRLPKLCPAYLVNPRDLAIASS